MCRSLVVTLLENLAIESDAVKRLVEEGQRPGSLELDRELKQLECILSELRAEGLLKESSDGL